MFSRGCSRMSQLLKRSPQRFPVQHHCYLRIRQVVQIIQPVLLCYSLLLRFPVCTGGLSPGNFLAVLLRHRITLTLHSDSRRSTGTIRPYRCSCSVFCSFLVQSGINSFSQLSVEIINLFTSQDSHTTFRGRSSLSSSVIPPLWVCITWVFECAWFWSSSLLNIKRPYSSVWTVRPSYHSQISASIL